MTIHLKPDLFHVQRVPRPIRKGLTHLGLRGIAVGVVLASSAVFVLPPLQAIQPGIDGATIGGARKAVIYTPPPDAGTPQPTGGTGSRGGCRYDSDRPSLISLGGQPHLMLTTSDRPTLWIYVPYSHMEAPTGTFSLQQGDNELYRGDFRLANTPGVIGISLPEAAPSLVAGQDYEWFVDIHCTAAIDDGTDADADPAILEGFVQRVPISDALVTDLANAQSDLDAVAAYGKHHIWYDLLTTLARLRLEAGPNAGLDTTWTDILSTDPVFLESWAMEPLLEEVTVGASGAEENTSEKNTAKDL